MTNKQSDIGLIGLAVMGQNLALNIADHGFKISVYNRTTSKTTQFAAENANTPGGVVATSTLEAFVESLSKPRKIIIMVKAGPATDAVIEEIAELLELGDIDQSGKPSLQK
jgi:6-phosphogluconate dehydrogenase